MSPSSGESSRSWTGGGRGATLDIIDLDRYMRGHVRGANKGRHAGGNNYGDTSRLIVDAGGTIPRKVTELSAASSSSRDKRYSHDSGLSDGSYHKKRQTRRRVSANARSLESGPRASLRNFRVHTERALKEQQEQIARVAEICERLTVRGGAGTTVGTARGGGGSSSGDSTGTSTTTSGGERMKDVRECKTYKIIMSKLDELNRMFATRARSPPQGAPAPRSANTCTPTTIRTLMERAVGSDVNTAPPNTSMMTSPPVPAAPVVPTMRDGAGSKYNTAPQTQSPPPLSRLTPALALQVDIAPKTHTTHRNTHTENRQARDKRNGKHSGTLNVATESVLHYSTPSGSLTGDSAGTSAGHYQLEDPLRLYAQAKRLQALQAQSRRARSADSSHQTIDRKRHIAETVIYNSRPSARDRSRGDSSSMSGVSVCALCRRYWRALTRCLHTIHVT